MYRNIFVDAFKLLNYDKVHGKRIKINYMY